MGYNITIGEYRRGRGEERATADTVRLDEAPAYGEPTDHTNQRWPSYSAWGDFLQTVGLTYLSPRTGRYAPDPDCPPLLDEHPGVMPVLPIHLERVEAAYEAYRDRIGRDKLPGWGTTEVYDKKSGRATEVIAANAELYDGDLARLEWLRFWLRWALTHCKEPVCANS